MTKFDHKEFSRKGALASHKAQFKGMTKKQISEHMKKVRAGKKKT
jgi:hypothetical protein